MYIFWQNFTHDFQLFSPSAGTCMRWPEVQKPFWHHEATRIRKRPKESQRFQSWNHRTTKTKQKWPASGPLALETNQLLLVSATMILLPLCAQSLPSHPTPCDPMDCSHPGSSVHGILQARILERAAISSSRGSSRPRDWTHVSCITGEFFTHWATWELIDKSIPNQHRLAKDTDKKYYEPSLPVTW